MNKDEIFLLRMNLGLTQERFAHLIGSTVTSVSRWENGHVKPNRFYVKEMQELKAKLSSPFWWHIDK